MLSERLVVACWADISARMSADRRMLNKEKIKLIIFKPNYQKKISEKSNLKMERRLFR